MRVVPAGLPQYKHSIQPSDFATQCFIPKFSVDPVGILPAANGNGLRPTIISRGDIPVECFLDPFAVCFLKFRYAHKAAQRADSVEVDESIAPRWILDLQVTAVFPLRRVLDD